jgi:hypothetical protein
MAKLKLTKAAIDRLPLTSKGQQVYWDSELRGFGLVVGMRTKSFVVQTNVHGCPVRVTLGQTGLRSCEEYRDRARRQLGQMKDGIDPREVERQARAKQLRDEKNAITLRQTFQAFKEAKANRLKANTIYDYEGVMRRVFGDWMDKPLRDITPSMIQNRHASVQREGIPNRAPLKSNGSVAIPQREQLPRS